MNTYTRLLEKQVEMLRRQLAEAEAAQESAFLAGWAISGEGWNGEYTREDPTEALREEFNKWKRGR